MSRPLRSCCPSPLLLQSNMTRFAAWMDGVAEFYEGLFRLSRAEAGGLDPQCRVLLENTWAAMQVRCCAVLCGAVLCCAVLCCAVLCCAVPVSFICWLLAASRALNPVLITALSMPPPSCLPPPQDAAPALGGTSLASTGTYVGCVWSEYQVLQDSQRLKPSVASLTGSGLNFLVGRVSYTFGFQGEAGQGRAGQGRAGDAWLWYCICTALGTHACAFARLLGGAFVQTTAPCPHIATAGPCIGMDTACSSSLVATHLGHRALLDGETTASGGPVAWSGAGLSWAVSATSFDVHQPAPSGVVEPPAPGANMPLYLITMQHLMQ